MESLETVVMMPSDTVEEVIRKIKSFLSEPEADLLVQVKPQLEGAAKIEVEHSYSRYKSDSFCFTTNEEVEEIFVTPKIELFETNETKNSGKPKASLRENYFASNNGFTCEFENCGAKLSNRNCLKQHISNVHNHKNKTYKCRFCGVTLTGEENIKRHMERYQDGFGGYKCPEENCDYRSPTNSAFLQHVRRHYSIYHYSCKKCSKSFASKKTLNNHAATHKDRSVICNFCEKLFKSNTYLKQHIHDTHMPREHRSTSTVKCDQCDKEFSSRRRLKVHISWIHNDSRDFACRTCSNTFKNRNSLRKHEKIHTGIKNHQCSYCEKRFLVAEKLRKHELIHTGEKNFSCSKCGKMYNQKVNMNTHEKKCAY